MLFEKIKAAAESQILRLAVLPESILVSSPRKKSWDIGEAIVE